MSELNSISETLYIPLLGRMYASVHHLDILYDTRALSISDKLPTNAKEMPGHTEYTSLASAVRSKNMDLYLQAFLSQYPDGIIVEIGCGLETVFYRNDNGQALWYELDLPEVLELRNKYFPEDERDRYLPYSMFDYAWIDIVKRAGEKHVMVIASGLFQYFSNEQVIDFIKHLTVFEQAQIVFDAVSPLGLKIANHYVRKMGKKNAKMLFSVDSPRDLAAQISANTTVIEEQKFYSLIKRNPKIKFATRLRMFFSDALNMVKMIHLGIQ